MKSKNPLDFYKNEKEFLMVDHAISAYFPLNPYAEKRRWQYYLLLKKNLLIEMI